MSNSVFHFKQFSVDQSQCAMKVGTDGVLLGAWAHGGERILDIGTGTGLIALMMAQRFPDSSITAIELDEKASRQAAENVFNSPFSGRVRVLHQSFQHFLSSFDVKSMTLFDAVVCNPPYFVDALKCPDEERLNARHAVALTFPTLLRGVKMLLASQGAFSVILPYDACREFESEASMHGLYLAEMCKIKTVLKKAPKRVLMRFSHHFGPVCSTEQCLSELGCERSEWYRKLTREFYL
ncbi:MAG: methyltransferase [Prevotella sp.]|nr:methyltransferase [Prevotella sp.]